MLADPVFLCHTVQNSGKMLKLLPNFGRIAQNLLTVSERVATGLRVNSPENCLMSGLRAVAPTQPARALSATPVLAKVDDRRAIKVPKRDEGTEGEANIGLEYHLSGETFCVG